MSPRMSDVLKVSANDEFDDSYQSCKVCLDMSHSVLTLTPRTHTDICT